MKVELTFAIGGVKNHEIYFYNLGVSGGRPTGVLLKQIEKDFGSYERWEAEFRGVGASARGWLVLFSAVLSSQVVYGLIISILKVFYLNL